MNPKGIQEVYKGSKKKNKPKEGGEENQPAPIQGPKIQKNQLYSKPEHSYQFLPKTKEKKSTNLSSFRLKAPHPRRQQYSFYSRIVNITKILLPN